MEAAAAAATHVLAEKSTPSKLAPALDVELDA